MAIYLNESSDEDMLPQDCLPVNDILDIVMHALVVSSSVGLDVKCNLGKYAEFHHIHHITALNKTSTCSQRSQ